MIGLHAIAFYIMGIASTLLVVAVVFRVMDGVGFVRGRVVRKYQSAGLVFAVVELGSDDDED